MEQLPHEYMVGINPFSNHGSGYPKYAGISQISASVLAALGNLLRWLKWMLIQMGAYFLSVPHQLLGMRLRRVTERVCHTQELDMRDGP